MNINKKEEKEVLFTLEEFFIFLNFFGLDKLNDTKIEVTNYGFQFSLDDRKDLFETMLKFYMEHIINLKVYTDIGNDIIDVNSGKTFVNKKLYKYLENFRVKKTIFDIVGLKIKKTIGPNNIEQIIKTQNRKFFIIM